MAKLITLNGQRAKFTGLPFDRMKGWNWTEFVHADDIEANVDEYRSNQLPPNPFIS